MSAADVGSGDRDAPVASSDPTPTERCPVCDGEGDLIVGREYDGQYATCSACGGTGNASDPTLPVPASRQTLEQVAREADRLADDGNLEALGAGLARLREFRQSVQDIERQVEDYVAGLMGQDQIAVGDWLTLERSRPSMRRTKWQSKALLFHLIGGNRLVNPETGEDVTDLLLECVPFTASLSWRTGALRERGVQVDEWCDEVPARRTVKATVLELEAGDG